MASPFYPEQKVHRNRFASFLRLRGCKTNTVRSMVSCVFYLWNKRGEGVFWSAVRSNENELRDVLKETLRMYNPDSLQYLSGYMTSFRHFREYMDSKDVSGNTLLSASSKEITEKPEMLTVPNTTRLTDEMLETAHRNVLSDPGYGSDYALIDSVLKRFPQNDDPEIVAMKMALIDMTNSTNLSRHRQSIVITELAQVVVNISKFDQRLQQGDPSLVVELAKCNGRINLFSFASKYCTYHSVDVYSHDDYVIYDQVVKKALPLYVPGLRESTVEQWRQTYQYDCYLRCIDNLLDENDIHIPFRRRKLDHYLWSTYRKR